jgi:hypothetical protein
MRICFVCRDVVKADQPRFGGTHRACIERLLAIRIYVPETPTNRKTDLLFQ